MENRAHNRLLHLFTNALLLLSLSANGSADTIEQADTLLHDLAARGASYAAVRGDFEQVRKISGLPIDLSSNGRFQYARETGIDWETLQPIHTAVRIARDGVHLVAQQSTDNLAQSLKPSTPQASQPQTSLFSTLILKVFAGDISALSPYFSATASGSLKGWRITLLPVNEQVAQHFVDIQIAGSEFTETILMREFGGDQTHITLKDIALQHSGSTD